MFADEVLELFGRGDLHYDLGPSAFLNLLFFEDIADVAWLDIHLQGAFFLVDNDSRGITLLHIVLEFALSGVSR